MKKYGISVIPGDGIGPEQVRATLKVLERVGEIFPLDFEFVETEAGDGCKRKQGSALPNDTVRTLEATDACLKGPVGESAYETIVVLRQMFDLYANLRPCRAFPGVKCLDPETDLILVRENTEDLYRGLEFEIAGSALALRVTTARACQRIASKAFRIAELRNRKKLVTAVHKAQVLRKTCGLFAATCREEAKLHAGISFEEMYVDAAAMNLIREPAHFDVLVTTNIFGDILSEEAAQVVGGLGLAPSGNIGDGFAIFEPIHGSAPDIAGKNVANPTSMLLSASMMLDWLGEKFGDGDCQAAASSLEAAVIQVLADQVTTPDLGGNYTTSQVGEAVAERMPTEVVR
ncbi:isocitrate/isopropylmalate dehydrogenase family protein [[Eubacterium] cellulosolvens]